MATMHLAYPQLQKTSYGSIEATKSRRRNCRKCGAKLSKEERSRRSCLVCRLARLGSNPTLEIAHEVHNANEYTDTMPPLEDYSGIVDLTDS